MNPRPISLFAWISLTACVIAAEPDPSLPQPFDPSTLETLVTASPFNRSINLADTLILTGLAYMEGKPVAYLLDTETKKTHVVRSIPNDEGWSVVSTFPAKKFEFAQVELKIGGETVTIRANAEAVAASKKGGPPPPSSNAPREGRGPSEGDRGFNKGKRGPSREDMERFQSAKPETQEKIKNFFRENRDRMMNMAEEDRGNFIRSSVDKFYSEEKAGSSGKR